MNIETVRALLGLLTAAPQLVGFAQTTLTLFERGAVTEAELQDLWRQAGEGVQNAIARWHSTPSGPLSPQ